MRVRSKYSGKGVVEVEVFGTLYGFKWWIFSEDEKPCRLLIRAYNRTTCGAIAIVNKKYSTREMAADFLGSLTTEDVAKLIVEKENKKKNR